MLQSVVGTVDTGITEEWEFANRSMFSHGVLRSCHLCQSQMSNIYIEIGIIFNINISPIEDLQKKIPSSSSCFRDAQKI